MSKTVRLTRRAKRELEQAAEWWATHRDRQQANKWYNAVINAIRKLAEDADNCQYAPENGTLAYQIRQKLVGVSRTKTHRIVFTIREADIVVIAIRHLAQNDLPSDFPLE